MNLLTLFLISNFFLFPLLSGPVPYAQQQSPLSQVWTACSSRMLLVLGQCLGFLYTPTTPFHQAGIPTTINQSGDSPWMSVNMFPSLPLFPTTFLSHSLCCSFDCSFFSCSLGFKADLFLLWSKLCINIWIQQWNILLCEVILCGSLGFCDWKHTVIKKKNFTKEQKFA